MIKQALFQCDKFVETKKVFLSTAQVKDLQSSVNLYQNIHKDVERQFQEEKLLEITV